MVPLKSEGLIIADVRKAVNEAVAVEGFLNPTPITK
jgi:hypothetical protein